jgi:hypothetical protein
MGEIEELDAGGSLAESIASGDLYFGTADKAAAKAEGA